MQNCLYQIGIVKSCLQWTSSDCIIGLLFPKFPIKEMYILIKLVADKIKYSNKIVL